jgi:large subunit ribosomal protein L23
VTVYEVIKRPLVTEKAYQKKEAENTLCFEVHKDANKVQIKDAVEQLLKLKVEGVRTATFEGKLRRRGRYAAYRSDWKKAFVRLKPGQKVPEYAEMV